MANKSRYPEYIVFSKYCEIINDWKNDNAKLIIQTLFKRGLSLYAPPLFHDEVYLDYVADDNKLMSLSVNRKNAAAIWHKSGYDVFPWPTNSENNDYDLLESLKNISLPKLSQSERKARKLTFKKTIKCKKCSEECYRFFFSQKTISVKDAVNLLNGVDTRTKQKLKHREKYFNAHKQAIKRAVNKKKPTLHLENGGRFLINGQLKANQFFKWAADMYPDFDSFLPENIPWVKQTAYLTFTSSIGVELSEEQLELRNLQRKIAKLKSEASASEHLKIEGEKHIKYRKSQSEKAKKPRKRK